MYSATHVSTFGALHLRGGAWYFNCRPGFTALGEEALFSSLSSIALVKAVADEEEAEHPTQAKKLKRAWRKKANDGTATEPIA